VMNGPSIVQQRDATTYILAGQQGSVDAYGNIVIVERQ